MNQEIFEGFTAREMIEEMLSITGNSLTSLAKRIDPDNWFKIQRSLHRWFTTSHSPTGQNKDLLIKIYKEITAQREELQAYKDYLGKKDKRIHKELREMIERIVKNNRITKAALAKTLGVSRSALYLWLDGINRPTPDKVDKLKKLDQLTEGENE